MGAPYLCLLLHLLLLTLDMNEESSSSSNDAATPHVLFPSGVADSRPPLIRSRTATGEGDHRHRRSRRRALTRSLSQGRYPVSDDEDGGESIGGRRSGTGTEINSPSRIRRIFNLAKKSSYLRVPTTSFNQAYNLRTPRPMHLGGDDSWPADYSTLSGPSTPRHPSGDTSTTLEDGGESRSFYDDFTTIDWPRDAVMDSSRRKALQLLGGIRGKLTRMTDAIQGWVLITIVGFSFALIAYLIDHSEAYLSDLRHGYCATGWYKSERMCCPDKERYGVCPNWMSWSEAMGETNAPQSLDFAVYSLFSMLFAYISVRITLRTKTVNPLFDEASEKQKRLHQQDQKKQSIDDEAELVSETDTLLSQKKSAQRVFYTGYGSGVPEVKTILSGFVIRKFLGTTTLIYKTVGLVFSVSSGMSLGKEGPFVHLSTCVGNIACRLSKKFSQNDMKRRQLLSAAASAGVSLAFGSPLGGILFSLEEVSYYFLPQQLFRMFFCAMISALFLKFLNPYGTGRIVIFSVTYPKEDWKSWELFSFILIGLAGGLYGALFCKFHMWWGRTFRQLKVIKNSPTFEVLLVAAVTVILTFPNELTSKGVSELLLDLARPCTKADRDDMGLCPSHPTEIPDIIGYLSYAFIVKVVLTAITFGLKVPAGIYIPSMVVGALFGRIFGLAVQYSEHTHTFGDSWTSSVVPGVYAMAAAGAFMAGVTRMNVTLAVILFELTGSLDHVLPFSIAILVANWMANAIEPSSIYELLIHKNDFPFLDNRVPTAFDSQLSDLVTMLPKSEIIDVQNSIYVSSTRLRQMLSVLQNRGEFDGCIPILKGKALMGLISAPELEFALDRIQTRCEELEYDEAVLCKMPVRDSDMKRYHRHYNGLNGADVSGDEEATTPGHDTADYFGFPMRYESQAGSDDSDDIRQELSRIGDLTPFIDRVPITMDIHSPLALVQMMFTQLGTRIICVVREGRFVGVLHKKKFIDFCHKNKVS